MRRWVRTKWVVSRDRRCRKLVLRRHKGWIGGSSLKQSEKPCLCREQGLEARGPGRFGIPEPNSGRLQERTVKIVSVRQIHVVFNRSCPFVSISSNFSFTLLVHDTGSDFGLVSLGEDFGSAFECDVYAIYKTDQPFYVDVKIYQVSM